MSPFTPELRLHDRYVLRERIGLGGMSEVWRADDEVLHRPVAVKALAGRLAADPQLRATIQREARAAARLTHPHVTQVYDYGEATLPGGVVTPYLVMELVEGQTLADRLAGGPLAWPDAVRTGGEVAAALAAAHRIGVVHRDVKPANVMLTETGAKVLDFGIAAPAGPHQPVTGPAGEPLAGTPAYFAPERLDPGPTHPAGDVYALGVLLYRSLTGRPPLPVRTWDDVLDLRDRRPAVPPPRVPGLPADVAALVLDCLAVDPARRPTAAQVADRLGAGRPVDPPTAFLSTVSGAERPATLVERRPTPARPVPPARPEVSPNRLTGVLVAGAVVLLLALVGALVFEGRSGPSPAAAPPATSKSTARSAVRPAPSRAAPTTRSPQPVTARQLADRFADLLDRAETARLIDRKTADDLRKKAAELGRGKPRERAKRVEDLHERIEDAADDDKIDGATATALRKVLDAYDRLRGVARDEG
ncbi:serine/threonine-protein kinase [Micromonospora sp. WMMD1128]|uniref:serine/threonine-protein kinase n=1 Tax=unclassified Micromonospora TaxID=2617518 RepID=UPI00248AB104|nr:MULTISPECIES: serine/threonine-protein kinase [unclassified Micromonospora]WBB76865.1 serine/threonine-protein kinase [Micromonospora sp. WMMD1128]WFE35350.1 serine/threonine-protein kinase [Micromonospora sp. WMMD975]